MSKEKDPTVDQPQDAKVSSAEPRGSAPAASFRYIGPDYVEGIWVRGHLHKLKDYSVTQAQELVQRCPETAPLFKF